MLKLAYVILKEILTSVFGDIDYHKLGMWIGSKLALLGYKEE